MSPMPSWIDMACHTQRFRSELYKLILRGEYQLPSELSMKARDLIRGPPQSPKPGALS